MIKIQVSILFYAFIDTTYDYETNDIIETYIVLLLCQMVRAIDLDSCKLFTQYNTTPFQVMVLRWLLSTDSRMLASLADDVGLFLSTRVGVLDR